MLINISSSAKEMQLFFRKKKIFFFSFLSNQLSFVRREENVGKGGCWEPRRPQQEHDGCGIPSDGKPIGVKKERWQENEIQAEQQSSELPSVTGCSELSSIRRTFTRRVFCCCCFNLQVDNSKNIILLLRRASENKVQICQWDFRLFLKLVQGTWS